jgi:hypothetical protein
MHNNVQCHHSIVKYSHNIIRNLSIIDNVDIIRVTDEAIKEVAIKEEDLEEVKD